MGKQDASSGQTDCCLSDLNGTQNQASQSPGGSNEPQVARTQRAAYLVTQAVISVAEAGIEAGVTYAWGGEDAWQDFSVAGTFGKNFMINAATGGIGSKGKWAYKAAAYVGRQAIEIGGDTGFDVYRGNDLTQSLVVNTIGSIAGDAAGRAIASGARHAWNSAAGQWTRAYVGGFAEGALSYGPRSMFTGALGGGAGDLGRSLAAGHARGLREARIDAMKKAGIPGASGGDFQIDRAWHYFQEGTLDRIEHAVGQGVGVRRPRVDLRLVDATRVELKSWRGFEWLPENVQTDMLRRLNEQVPTYLGGRGRHLRVEFDQLVPQKAEQVLKRLELQYGKRLWFGAV